MKKLSIFRILIAGTFLVGMMFIAMGLNVPSVAATTFNTVTIDGTVAISASDWEADENMGVGGGAGGSLYITWDNTNMYFGMTPGPTSGGLQLFFDTASGGATVSVIGSFAIGQGAQGYEYATILAYNSSNTSNYVWNGSSWVSGSPATGVGYGSTAGSDLELKVPWTTLGSPTTPLTVLAVSSAGSTINDYWPSSNTPPPFTIGFRFDNPQSSGISPNGAPTAIELNAVNAEPMNGSYLVLLGVAFLLVSTGLLVLRQRLAVK